ncbi:MAG: hypothetical protein AAF340_15635 [Pseudomonadota bacterium]
MIKALAFLLAMTGAAHASAWEEFQRRCLVPMADFSVPDLSGLIVTTKTDGKNYPYYMEVTFGYYQEGDPKGLDAFLIVITHDFDRIDQCQLIVRSGNVDQLVVNARAGLQGVDLPFVQIGEHNGLEHWHSDDWREPILSVGFGTSPKMGGFMLLALETDLES